MSELRDTIRLNLRVTRMCEPYTECFYMLDGRPAHARLIGANPPQEAANIIESSRRIDASHARPGGAA